MIDQEVTAQLHGVARVLERAVAGHVGDPYAADVLAGVIATIDTLAAATEALDDFVAEDIAATSDALTVLGADAPTIDSEASPAARLQLLRAALEARIETADLDGSATVRLAEIFQRRAARYPLQTRPARTHHERSDAHQPR